MKVKKSWTFFIVNINVNNDDNDDDDGSDDI
jgi:hypothetical protein